MFYGSLNYVTIKFHFQLLSCFYSESVVIHCFVSFQVNSGADFIITQLCFSTENLIAFIENCRSSGITIPIVIGIFVPDNWRSLQRMCEITRVKVPQEDLQKYQALQFKPKKFKTFAIQQAVKMIHEIFRKDINIYGVHFFSMNKFNSISLVVKEIFANDISNQSLQSLQYIVASSICKIYCNKNYD